MIAISCILYFSDTLSGFIAHYQCPVSAEIYSIMSIYNGVFRESFAKGSKREFLKFFTLTNQKI